jgi:hypothetical protein
MAFIPPDPTVLRRLTRRLEDASGADWELVARTLAPMRGPGFSQLWHRAQHRALWQGSARGAGRVLLDLLFAASELWREFNPRTQREFVAQAKARGPGALSAEYHAAFIELWELTVARTAGDDVTAEAVVLAGAVASRTDVDVETLKRAWAPLEAVVPIAAVRPPSRQTA